MSRSTDDEYAKGYLMPGWTGIILIILVLIAFTIVWWPELTYHNDKKESPVIYMSFTNDTSKDTFQGTTDPNCIEWCHDGLRNDTNMSVKRVLRDRKGQCACVYNLGE